MGMNFIPLLTLIILKTTFFMEEYSLATCLLLEIITNMEKLLEIEEERVSTLLGN